MIQHDLFEYLVNSVWQLPVLVAATWLLIRVARPALAFQHALWLATLILAVLLPMRGMHWSAEEFESAPVLNVESAPLISPAVAVQTPSASPGLRTLTELHVQPLRLSDRTIDWILELYAVSMAFSLARLVHGYLAARKLAKGAVEQPLTALESTLLNVCARRLGLPADRVPDVRYLDDFCATPMVIGVRHPVMLLPAGMRHAASGSFNDLNLMAVFSHELAHVRRRDYLANLIARIVSLPVAYHPVGHVLHARIRQTREMICDTSAAGAFDSASSYARSLLAIADRIVEPSANVEAVGLFDRARNTLEERIMNLTSERLPVHLSLRVVRIAAGAAILVAATGTAATVHFKPAACLMATAPVVYAAQVPQAAPAPAPAPAPSPAPAPKSHAHAHVIINGEARDLTPEEREQLDRDLADSKEAVRKATEQLRDPLFQQRMADGVNFVNSPEFMKQMEQVKIQLKTLTSPEHMQQLMDAQKLSAQAMVKLPQLKLDMSQLKVQLDSPELRAEIKRAKELAEQYRADADARTAETRKQLDEAAAAIAEARREVANDANVQQQLDHAQKSIQDAAKNIR